MKEITIVLPHNQTWIHIFFTKWTTKYKIHLSICTDLAIVCAIDLCHFFNILHSSRVFQKKGSQAYHNRICIHRSPFLILQDTTNLLHFFKPLIPFEIQSSTGSNFVLCKSCKKSKSTSKEKKWWIDSGLSVYMKGHRHVISKVLCASRQAVW